VVKWNTSSNLFKTTKAIIVRAYPKNRAYTILSKSVNDENRKMPLNVRSDTKEMKLKNTRRKQSVVPSFLTSGVNPSKPYPIKYMIRQEKTIIKVSITRMAVLERTLLAK
jgi:hypothetical protein